MKLKLLGAIICVFLLVGTTIPVMGMSITDVVDVPGDYFKDLAVDQNETHFITTGGPISSFVTDITLHNGSSAVQMGAINRLVNRKFLHLFHPLSFIPVNNLNFTISFTRDIARANSRFSYVTVLSEYQNDTVNHTAYIFNTMHTVTVKGFNGCFMFTRARPLRLAPAYFVFYGSYEEITIA
jgi:hypothetical protein